MGKFVTQLSNSAVDRYNDCSLCYKLHYIDRIRPVKKSSALVFGGAIDNALNIILLERDLQKSLDLFEKEWTKNKVDKNVIYYKTNIDKDLLDYYKVTCSSEVNDLAWNSIYLVGKLIIEAYYHKVLPKIKEVIAVQKEHIITSPDGDEIKIILDLIIKWEDGKTYLLDNKTSKDLYNPESTKEDQPYGPTSAKDSQQLPLYHFAVKDLFKLDGVGYIVLCKTINKNKVKKCKSCGAINTGSHKKCNEFLKDTPTAYRCNGEFEITVNPSVDIDYIFNQVEESDEDRVLEAFDKANFGITNKIFETRHNPIRGKFGYCPYSLYTPDSPDFYKLPDRK